MRWAKPNSDPATHLSGQQGMGLGFFIAKTLIEQTGGSVRALNLEGGGACVAIRWPRGAIDGERPPASGKHRLITYPGRFLLPRQACGAIDHPLKR